MVTYRFSCTERVAYKFNGRSSSTVVDATSAIVVFNVHLTKKRGKHRLRRAILAGSTQLKPLRWSSLLIEPNSSQHNSYILSLIHVYELIPVKIYIDYIDRIETYTGKYSQCDKWLLRSHSCAKHTATLVVVGQYHVLTSDDVSECLSGQCSGVMNRRIEQNASVLCTPFNAVHLKVDDFTRNLKYKVTEIYRRKYE